jgi:hypothetical protein
MADVNSASSDATLQYAVSNRIRRFGLGGPVASDKRLEALLPLRSKLWPDHLQTEFF